MGRTVQPQTGVLACWTEGCSALCASQARTWHDADGWIRAAWRTSLVARQETACTHSGIPFLGDVTPGGAPVGAFVFAICLAAGLGGRYTSDFASSIGGIMNEPTTRGIYDFWSHFYDVVCSKIVQRRQRLAIPRMGILPGQAVLDIGIGTGLSLELYPPGAKVVGIDISEGMLRYAKRRARRVHLASVDLVQADALRLPFADDSFDYVLVSHVITVVSNPIQAIEEICRVGKPGARIVIINHFQSGNRMMALIEKWLCPVCTKLGWRSDLSFEHLMDLTDLEVDFRYKLDHLDLWETIFITNDPSPRSRSPAAAA